MNGKKTLLGTLAYTILTFAIAIIWHIVLFEPFYLSVGYFGENPSFLIGFISIVIQGFLLSWGFQKVNLSSAKYVAFLGIFFWTSHVLAHIAKNTLASWSFLLTETIYLVIQFGLFWIVLRVLWKK